MIGIKRKFSQKTRGQAMAEFALTIPVFLLLVFGIIELSRFFLVYSSVFTAVREATRFGSSVGDQANPNYQNCEMIAETAVRMGNFGGVQTEDVIVYFESEPGTWVADCDPDDDPEVRYQPVLGDRVVVEIDTAYDSLLGVVPDLLVSAENGRTIMLGINQQVAVVNTVKPGGTPTSTSTQIVAATATSNPTPTSTTVQNPTSTTVPTNTPSSTPVTPVVCVEPSIVLEKVKYENSTKEVVVTIKNSSNETFRLNKFNGLQWDKSVNLIKIKWDDTSFYTGKANSPAGNISIGSHDLQISSQASQTITFGFDGNSNNLKIKFDLIFYNLDGNCPTETKNISNY